MRHPGSSSGAIRQAACGSSPPLLFTQVIDHVFLLLGQIDWVASGNGTTMSYSQPSNAAKVFLRVVIP
jgi:hypothetical protein